MRYTVRGFTLLELIVVIAIIGILSVIIIPSFKTALARSRDAQRKLDILNIQKMMDDYALSDKPLPSGSYPHPSMYGRQNISPGFWDGYWDLSSSTSTVPFMKFLVDAGIASKVPVDPLSTSNYSNGYPYDPGYRYWYRPYIVYWDTNTSSYIYIPGYMIGIAKFENSTDNVLTFVGCPSQINANGAYNNLIYVVCGRLR